VSFWSEADESVCLMTICNSMHVDFSHRQNLITNKARCFPLRLCTLCTCSKDASHGASTKTQKKIKKERRLTNRIPRPLCDLLFRPPLTVAICSSTRVSGICVSVSPFPKKKRLSLFPWSIQYHGTKVDYCFPWHLFFFLMGQKHTLTPPAYSCRYPAEVDKSLLFACYLSCVLVFLLSV
jgi:hypothetical protein